MADKEYFSWWNKSAFQCTSAKILSITGKRNRKSGKWKSISIDENIAATNTSLEKWLKKENLGVTFYRLNVIKIKYHHWREKRRYPLIVKDIINRLNFQLGMHIARVTDEVNEKLMEYTGLEISENCKM